MGIRGREHSRTENGTTGTHQKGIPDAGRGSAARRAECIKGKRQVWSVSGAGRGGKGRKGGAQARLLKGTNERIYATIRIHLHIKP